MRISPYVHAYLHLQRRKKYNQRNNKGERCACDGYSRYLVSSIHKRHETTLTTATPVQNSASVQCHKNHKASYEDR